MDRSDLTPILVETLSGALVCFPGFLSVKVDTIILSYRHS